MRRSVVAALLLALVVTACAGGGDDEPAPAPEDSATPGEASPPAAGSEEPIARADSADGTLHLGYVLPETGPIAYLGPPQVAAVRFAVERINAAGGVLGNEVTVASGDEAGDPDIARQAVDRHFADGVDAIIGAAASSISLSIIDAITGAEVVQCSGVNTGDAFTDYDDGGFYFRTVPSNTLQGPVLANRIVEDGHVRIAVGSRTDDYGRSLSQSVADALREVGAEVTTETTYDPNLADFSPVADELTADDPDAVVLISFEEGAQILRHLIETGYGPEQIGLYGTDGMPLPELAGMVNPEDASVLAGFTATGASSGFDDDFIASLQDFDPELETTLFAPYTYDCVVVIALAAEAAGSDDPVVYAPEIVGVTRDGEECTSFEQCRDLLADGVDIDYTGASGPLDFIEQGEPSVGLYDVLVIDASGEVTTDDTVLTEPLEGR